jgi:glycosyltransferase involved in cell wall biosynthesis
MPEKTAGTRVALMSSSYLPDLGGVEELSHNLALGLQMAGDTVEVWTAKVPAVGPPTEDRIDSVTIRRFPFVLPAMRPWSVAQFPLPAVSTMRALRKAVRDFRPDLLHVHCFGPNGVYATGLATFSRLPLIVTLHGETINNEFGIFERSILLRRAIRIALRRAAAVTGCSQFTLDDAIARFGLRPERAEVIFNGVNLDEFTVADRTNRSTGALTVLAMGRMVDNKGFDLLLNAFARVAADHPESDLVLAGDGRAQADLQTRAAQLGLAARVRFPGRLDRSQVGAALAAADVFVVPSRVEPFGIVILEAWNAALPVIATNRGGPPEFVADGVDGLLVDTLDVGNLSRLLDQALSDANLRGRLAQTGQLKVQSFGWPAVTEHYRDLYARVLASHSQ